MSDLDAQRSGGVECDALVNDPAPRKRPGSWQREVSPDADPILLTAEALAYAAQIRAAAMKDKGYRTSFVGGEVGRFMRAVRLPYPQSRTASRHLPRTHDNQRYVKLTDENLLLLTPAPTR